MDVIYGKGTGIRHSDSTEDECSLDDVDGAHKSSQDCVDSEHQGSDNNPSHRPNYDARTVRPLCFIATPSVGEQCVVFFFFRRKILLQSSKYRMRTGQRTEVQEQCKQHMPTKGATEHSAMAEQKKLVGRRLRVPR